MVSRLAPLPEAGNDMLQVNAQSLDREVAARAGIRSRHSSSLRTLMVARYVGGIFDRVHLQGLLAVAQPLLPHALRADHLRPLLCFSYLSDLGASWFNYRSLVDGSTYSFQQLQRMVNVPCHCHIFPPQFCPEGHDGCLLTAAPDFLSWRFPDVPALASLMARGTGYRPQQIHQVDQNARNSALDALGSALDRWVRRTRRRITGLPPIAAFQPWRQAVLDNVRSALDALPDGLLLTDPFTPAYGCRESQAMRLLQEDCVITYADKLSGNFVIVCRRHAMHALLHDISSMSSAQNPTYVRVSRAVDVVIHELIHEVHYFGFPMPPAHQQCLPIYSLIAKLHKLPIGWRFLCLSSRHVLHAPAVWMTRLLRAIGPDVEQLWDVMFDDFPVDRHLRSGSWILRNSAGVLPVLERHNTDVRPPHLFPGQSTIQTMDFERLYTGLPQEDILRQLHALFVLVWSRHSYHPFLLLSADSNAAPRWLSLHELPPPAQGGDVRFFRERGVQLYLFDRATALQMLDLLVTRAYFRVGDAVFLQRIGIPMGLNPCVFIANYYLFMYERQFYLQMLHALHHGDDIQRHTAERVLAAFVYSFRYVDDWGSVTFDSEFQRFWLSQAHVLHGLRGIYPASLVLADTSIAGGLRAHYMDIHIHRLWYRGPLLTDIYDRRQEPRFQALVTPVRLPHAQSAIWSGCGYSVLYSQLVRFHDLCSYSVYWARNAARLILDMIVVDYDCSRLLRLLSRHVPQFSWRYGLSPQRLYQLVLEHMREFLCRELTQREPACP